MRFLHIISCLLMSPSLFEISKIMEVVQMFRVPACGNEFLFLESALTVLDHSSCLSWQVIVYGFEGALSWFYISDDCASLISGFITFLIIIWILQELTVLRDVKLLRYTILFMGMSSFPCHLIWYRRVPLTSLAKSFSLHDFQSLFIT